MNTSFKTLPAAIKAADALAKKRKYLFPIFVVKCTDDGDPKPYRLTTSFGLTTHYHGLDVLHEA